MAVAPAPFGTLPDGREVEAFTLSGGGVEATVLSVGATLHAVRVPDREGRVQDVVVGPADLAGYFAQSSYFGATVGRYANRIAGGRFALDGRTYRLSVNEGANTLHGGVEGFDKRLWDVVEVGDTGATLRLVSPDGDQGFPGELTATAIYAIDEAGDLSVTYRATTTAPTVVNLTNHAYWNLSGDDARSATAMRLTIPADRYTPVNAALIPTGELRDVTGTAFDFREATEIGARLRDGRDEQLRLARGYDHNWVVSSGPAGQPRFVARITDPVSGRTMDLLSTEPGLQVYSGNFLDGTFVGKVDRFLRQGDAICLEPQRFPDTPNRPAFGSARLDPGESYEHRIVWRFSVPEVARQAEPD